MVDKNTTARDGLLCPIRYSIEMIGGKWKLPIICMLASGMPQRYSSIKRKLGDVTNMMLSQSLKELEAAGMVHREQYNEVPPHVEYSLTEKGISLVPILVQLAAWSVEDMQSDCSCGVKCTTCQATK